MKRSARTLVGLAVVIVMLVMSLGACPALAAPVGQEEATEIEFTGTVVAVDETAGTIEVEVEDEDGRITSYIVQVPEEFDLSTVAVGDTVEVEGTLGEGGVVVATKVKNETEDEPEEPTPTATVEPTPILTPTVVLSPTAVVTGTVGPYGDKGNSFCQDPTRTHPVAAGIAETYGVTYEEVMGWFCQQQKAGFGQIMLALQTAEATGGTADELLARRAGGEGWGQIWKDLGLTGKGRKGGTPDDGDEAEDGEPAEDEDQTGAQLELQGKGNKAGQGAAGRLLRDGKQTGKPSQEQGAASTQANGSKAGQGAGTKANGRTWTKDTPSKDGRWSSDTGQPAGGGKGKGGGRK